MEVVAEAQDNSISAYKSSARPGWTEVVEAIEAGLVDTVVAYHLDRVTRSTAELETIIALCERTGVSITTVTGDISLDNDTGRLIARVLGAVARAEVERKAARAALGHAQRASRGEHFKGASRAFGYSEDRSEIVPEEADAIRWAVHYIVNGGTLSGVAAEWHDRGLRSAKSGDKDWAPSSVRELLTSPRYVGMNTYKGNVVGPGNWEPILSPEEHAELIAVLADRHAKYAAGHANRNVDYLCSGLITCGRCGERLTGYHVTKQNRTYYKCKSKRGCVQAPLDRVDAFIERETLSLLTAPKALKRLNTPRVHRDTPEARKALYDRLRGLAGAFAEGRMDAETYDRVSGIVKDQLDQLDAEDSETIKTQSRGRGFKGLTTENLKEKWEKLPLEHKRTIIDALWDITINPVVPKGSKWSEEFMELSLKA